MYRRLTLDCRLKGAVLAILERLFPKGAPSVQHYAREVGVAPSTFRRAAEWLLNRLSKLFADRRPGPPPSNGVPSVDRDRDEALRTLADLRTWVETRRSKTSKRRSYTPEARQRIAQVAEAIRASGALSFEEIARVLEIPERQLRRIRKEVEEAGGGAPEPKSRRPKKTGELADPIQRLIAQIAASAPKRRPYRASDIKEILEKKYRKQLLRHHGSATIALTTVSKYLRRGQKKHREHPRGSYVYPEPFELVAIDTSYFELFGITFYFVTVFEMAGRLNLLTWVFLRENTAAIVRVLERYLERYPGVAVVVIDRGKPYLNETVRRLLEEGGKLRLVCPPASPTARAASERHFEPLKGVLRRAITEVFAEDPGWSAEALRKLLEVAISVFRILYPHIPQQGIDGRSPAERILDFDPVRAARRLADLVDRSVRWEPDEEKARWIHHRFQLQGSEEETINALKRFGTAVLTELAQEVEPYFGPPHPDWAYDPLGYLEAKARAIFVRHVQASIERQCEEEERKRKHEEAKRHQEAMEAERLERAEYPERFVDRALDTLVQATRIGLHLPSVIESLQSLLRALSEKLGRAFAHELDRLRRRVSVLDERPEVIAKILKYLETFELPRGLTPG